MKNDGTSTADRILVVDDEAEICHLLSNYLSRHGDIVETVGDGGGMRKVLDKEVFDLVILDLGLPDEDGFSLARYLREHTEVGIIILTGRGDTVDKVVGLEIGADDYVAKPFDLRELLAGVKSVLRRVSTIPSAAADAELGVFAFADWKLDISTRQLTSPTGTTVLLTIGEFAMLKVFLQHPNQVLSRDDLMDATHGREASPFDRSIDVQIGRLRRKTEADPEHPILIQTVRGAGYIFTSQPIRI